MTAFGSKSGKKKAVAGNMHTRELWSKAKLLVMQRVNQDKQVRALQGLVDDTVRSNSLAAMEKAVERRRAKTRLLNPDAPDVKDLAQVRAWSSRHAAAISV